jgi:hypothetical protein
MKGIHCALQGRLGQDVELRRSESGKDLCQLSVGVAEGYEVAWVSVSVFEDKARALAGLCQGRSGCTSKAAYWIRACGGTGAV